MARSRFVESAYSFAAQWPYLRYLGMGAWWAWIWLCYNSIELMVFLPAGQQPFYVLLMYLCSTIGIASMMLVAAFSWRRFTPFIRRRGVVIAFALVACASTLVLGYSSFIGGQVVFIIAAVLTGVGTSMLCLKCGDIYGSIAMRESLTAGSVSLIFAAFLYFMGVGLPVSWRIAFIALMPIVSALLLVMPGEDPFPAAEQQVPRDTGKQAGHRTYVHLVIAAAAVAFTAGVGKGISSTMLSYQTFAYIGSIITFAITVIAGIIIWMVNNGDIVRSTKRVYSLLMLLGVIVLLAAFFGLDLSYLSIGKETLWMVFSCLMAYMAFRFDMPAVRAFGFGQAAYFITSTVGWYIGAIIPDYLGVEYARMAICIVFAVVIVILLTFVFTDSDIKFILTWREMGPTGHPDETGGQRFEPSMGTSGTDQGAGVRRSGSGVIGPDGESVESGDAQIGNATMGASMGSPSDEPPSDASIHELVSRLDPRFGLSTRELEILEMFAQGRSANWIADDLTVSKNTVRSHLRSIYVKLDVHSRQELLDLLARNE